MKLSFRELSSKVKTIILREKLSKEKPRLPYNYIISFCDIDSQRILYSDYVDNLDPDWYKSYYSKATYYRLKRAALEKFLELYESL